MEINFEVSSANKIPEYSELYKICFPDALHLQAEYLSWFYKRNPEGPVVGVDAVVDNKIVGHVVSIPVVFELNGVPARGLLAVNVVVHPAFQGKHLFKKLGLKMCDEGASKGYSFVIGVSNAAATLGWTRQMGFQLVKPLDACIGFGPLGISSFTETLADTAFRRVWTDESLRWRCENPVNNIFLMAENDTSFSVCAKSGKAGILAYTELPKVSKLDFLVKKISPIQHVAPRLFLGLIPKHHFSFNYKNIPHRFRPSPLNFIYKNLADSSHKLNSDSVFLNFLDFDAF